MIKQLIALSARNRFIVLLLYAIVIGVGIWATVRTPLDAIPDVSDNQVIVYVDWPGRSPQLVEDQVTYPLASNLQRSEEHTSELQPPCNLVCRLLLEKKNSRINQPRNTTLAR